MVEGNRVGLTEEGLQNSAMNFPHRGTVIRVSPAGYRKVLWDDGTVSHFSPAYLELSVLSGLDAQARHLWSTAEGPCARCRVKQTDENYHAPCRPGG